MKKTLLSLAALACSLGASAITAVTPAAGTANPFAYDLTGEVVAANQAMNLTVNYKLNTAANAVSLQVLKDGEVVAEQTGLATAKGAHTATIDLTELLGGAAYYGEYTWQIAVTGGATSGNPVEFKQWKFYHPSGIDVDNSFESASFGTIFVTDGYTKGKTSGYESAQANGTDGGGLYMFTPDLNNILNKDGGKRFYSNKLTHSYSLGGSTCGADFARVAVAEDGRIFVTRHNDAGDYILSAENVEALKNGKGFTSLVEGRTMESGKYYNDDNGNFLVGPNQGFDVKGTGEDTKLLALSCADNSLSFAYTKNRVMEYEIGTSNTLPAGEVVAGLDKKYTISYDRSVEVTYDNRGGIWYCQSRQTPSDEQPALVYIDANGNQKFFEGNGGLGRRRGAISVNYSDTQLAVASAYGKQFSIYDIKYAADGAISLTEVHRITVPGNNLYCLAWDAAGNVYAGNATSEYVKGIAIPRANNTFATKAASKYDFVVDEATAVEAIEAENAPVEYYNLQGVKVENPSNGIFIKKQGTKTTKVVL